MVQTPFTSNQCQSSLSSQSSPKKQLNLQGKKRKFIIIGKLYRFAICQDAVKRNISIFGRSSDEKTIAEPAIHRSLLFASFPPNSKLPAHLIGKTSLTRCRCQGRISTSQARFRKILSPKKRYLLSKRRRKCSDRTSILRKESKIENTECARMKCSVILWLNFINN